MLLKHLFVMLHVLCAAGWFGLALPLAGQARRAAAEPPQAAGPLLDLGARTVRLMTIFLVLTLLFALGGFFLGGGFAVYGPPYHTSLLLILVLLGVQLGLIRPGWQKLQAAVGSGDADAARKRVAMGVGVGHLLWLIILVLMYWNRLTASV
jgi:hypothetical protein